MYHYFLWKNWTQTNVIISYFTYFLTKMQGLFVLRLIEVIPADCLHRKRICCCKYRYKASTSNLWYEGSIVTKLSWFKINDQSSKFKYLIIIILMVQFIGNVEIFVTEQRTFMLLDFVISLLATPTHLIFIY